MNDSIDAKVYRRQLFRHVPMYTTKLVREGEFTFRQRDQVENPDDVATIFREYFRDKDREEFVIVLLDTANTLIGMSSVSVGGLAATIVEPRQVFKVAALANAAGIIAAHNHLSGNPEPSPADIKITRQLTEVGKLMGIPLLDHIIVCEKTQVSLAAHGLLNLDHGSDARIHEDSSEPYPAALFKMGQCVITEKALAVLRASGDSLSLLLYRHSHGDWGKRDDEANSENKHNPNPRKPILSRYKTDQGCEIVIVTEGNRMLTTVLLADEFVE